MPLGEDRVLGLVLNYVSFALFASMVAPSRVRGDVEAILVYESSPITVEVPALVLRALKRAPLPTPAHSCPLREAFGLIRISERGNR